MVRNPVVGSGRVIDSRAKLAAMKQDLLAHVDGTGFRQDTNSVDMYAQLVHYPHETLQGTLEALENGLVNGNTFVSIGDGTHSFGTFTIGVDGIATIEQAFAAALLTARLADGGTILVRAGAYSFTSTVTLPPGINVIGEHSGTKLIATTDNPLFLVSAATHVDPGFADTAASDYNLFAQLIMSDGEIAESTVNLGSYPFILCRLGSNVKITQCSVFGNVDSISGIITKSFVEYDNSVPSTNSSSLIIENSSVVWVQQAIDFSVTAGLRNVLKVNGNRLWVNGIAGAGASEYRKKCAVAFSSGNIELRNNDIMFEFSGGGTAETCFATYEDPSLVESLIITGNKYRGSATGTNRLFKSEVASLNNYNAIILNNITGGTGDSTWYITVGDGVQTVGDLNGAEAIQDVLSLFSVNSGSVHASLVVFVKPGSYTINSTSMKTPGLPVALIGLAPGGNFPTITLETSTVAANEQPIIFGCHLENLYFKASNNYYRVMLKDSFTNPDARTNYFSTALVKNCSFHNVGIGSTDVATYSGDTQFDRNVIIEGCKFSTSSSVLNGNITRQVAIYLPKRNGKIIIDNCATVKSLFCGLFFYLIPNNAAHYNTEIIISGCNLSCNESFEDTAYISFFSVPRLFLFENNSVDFSYNLAMKPIHLIDISTASPPIYHSVSVIIKNNEIVGKDSYPTKFFVGLADTLVMEGNRLSNMSSFAELNNTASVPGGILQQGSYTVTNNVFYASDNNFHNFVRFSTGTVISSGANITITNNNFYGSDNPTNGEPASVYSYIGITYASATVNISNNTIKNIHIDLNNDANPVAVINVVNPSMVSIVGNIITAYCDYADNVVGIIYVGANTINSGTDDDSNKTYCKIFGNYIETPSTLGATEVLVKVKSIKYFDIQNNTLNSAGNTLRNYIEAYSYTLDTQGSIIDNMLSHKVSPVVFGSGIDYALDGSALDNINIRVERNRNQESIKYIYCTEFKKYGYAYDSTSADLSVFRDATLLLRDVDKIRTVSHIDNKNRNQQHITRDGLEGETFLNSIGNWGIPQGLYYTNAFKNGLNASMYYTGAYNDSIKYMHHVIMPINLPDFVTLNSINIPIYLKNLSVGTLSFRASASLFLGNEANVSNRFEYIADPGAAASWAYKQTLLTTMTESNIILSTTDINKYISPAASPADIIGGINEAARSFYILLALYSTDSASGVNAGIAFAIPHVKVTYTY